MRSLAVVRAAAIKGPFPISNPEVRALAHSRPFDANPIRRRATWTGRWARRATFRAGGKPLSRSSPSSLR